MAVFVYKNKFVKRKTIHSNEELVGHISCSSVPPFLVFSLDPTCHIETEFNHTARKEKKGEKSLNLFWNNKIQTYICTRNESPA